MCSFNEFQEETNTPFLNNMTWKCPPLCPTLKTECGLGGVAIQIRPTKRMFYFSPLFFTSEMLSFFFRLNDRLSSVEDVQIAVKKSGKESFLFSFYNCKKQTPRVWDMGETEV